MGSSQLMDHSRTETDLWDWLSNRTHSFTDEIAISSLLGDLTFGRLFEIAEQWADDLARAGIGQQACVALALPNGSSFVPAFLALVKLSATIALVSPRYGSEALAAISENVRPECILTDSSALPSVANSFPVHHSTILNPNGLHGAVEALFPHQTAPLAPGSQLPDPAADLLSTSTLLKFTKGSTGKPKCIALTAGNLVAEMHNVTSTLGLGIGDRIYACVPLTHSYGFDLGVLAGLCSGATLVVRDTFRPRQVINDIVSQRASIFLGVPRMYDLLLRVCAADIPRLDTVRFLLSCTAPLPVNLLHAFYEKFRLPICQHYGTSETGALANHDPTRVLDRPASVGRPVAGVEIQILDRDSNKVPPNTEGEVVIRSDAVAQGYIMERHHGEYPFRNRQYWTADLGSMDEAGFLFLHGRRMHT